MSATAQSTVTNWSCGFLITLTFSLLSDALGQSGVLYCYAGVCLAGGVFVLTILPETRGMSLEEVEQMFIERAHSSSISS